MNDEGARTAVTRERLPVEGKALEGGASVRKRDGDGGTADVRAPKPGEPRIGSGLQHAHEPRVAKDVEAVRNREDGTCPAARQHRTEAERRGLARTGPLEDAPEVMSMDGRSL